MEDKKIMLSEDEPFVYHNSKSLVQAAILGAGLGIDVFGEIDRVCAKYRKKQKVMTQADYDRIEAAKIKRERKNKKRMAEI